MRHNLQAGFRSPALQQILKVIPNMKGHSQQNLSNHSWKRVVQNIQLQSNTQHISIVSYEFSEDTFVGFKNLKQHFLRIYGKLTTYFQILPLNQIHLEESIPSFLADDINGVTVMLLQDHTQHSYLENMSSLLKEAQTRTYLQLDGHGCTLEPGDVLVVPCNSLRPNLGFKDIASTFGTHLSKLIVKLCIDAAGRRQILGPTPMESIDKHLQNLVIEPLRAIESSLSCISRNCSSQSKSTPVEIGLCVTCERKDLHFELKNDGKGTNSSQAAAFYLSLQCSGLLNQVQASEGLSTSCARIRMETSTKIKTGAKVTCDERGGTVGGFCLMYDKNAKIRRYCVIGSNHVLVDGSEVFVQDQDTNEKILIGVCGHWKVGVGHLDIKSVVLREELSNPKGFDPRFRNSHGKYKPCRLYHYSEHAQQLSGRMVHIWGAETMPGKGIIVQPNCCLNIKGFTKTSVQQEDDSEAYDTNTRFILIRDLCQTKRFCKEGDSGAFVLADALDDKTVLVIGMLLGGFLGHDGYYYSFGLELGLKELERRSGGNKYMLLDGLENSNHV